VPRRRADQSRRTFSAKRSTCHHPPGIKNCRSESYAEIGSDGSGSHSYAKPTPEKRSRAGDPPRLSSIPGGQLWQSVQVAIFDRRHRETVRAVRTPRHCHHLPGIRNSRSDSYAEIETGSLHTRLPNVVRARLRTDDSVSILTHCPAVSQSAPDCRKPLRRFATESTF
jgi:hypothetical protein